MGTTFERLDALLNRFARYNGCQADSYLRCIEEGYEDNDEYELELFDAIGKILNNAEDISKWEYVYVGGFDSPGYSIDCYCLIVLDENNEIHTYAVNFECF